MLKVSIITITRNNYSVISRCLASIKSQNYSDIEHIVIDGASIDGTLDILFSESHHIKKLLSEPDRGIYDALNKGIKHATGEVIGILHADDIFFDENTVSQIAEIFKANPSVDMVSGGANYFKLNKKNIVRNYSSIGFRLWMMRFGFMPAHTASFIRKRVYEDFGIYDAGYISAGDFELFVRLMWRNRISYALVDRVLVLMEVGGLSTSGIKSFARSTKEILKALKQNGFYSNCLFVVARLPIKFIQGKIFRIRILLMRM